MIKIGKFIHCCQFMRDIIEEGMVDLVFANDVLEYYIPIRDPEAPLDEFRDATEFQRIDYCPWCGKKLTFDKNGALRDNLIAEIENIGFPDQFDIFSRPQKYKNDTWWREKAEELFNLPSDSKLSQSDQRFIDVIKFFIDSNMLLVDRVDFGARQGRFLRLDD